MKNHGSCQRYSGFLAGFCLFLSTVAGCNEAEDAAKQNREDAAKQKVAIESTAPSVPHQATRSAVELREERLRSLKEELLDLKRKVALLDEGDHVEQSRSLLVDAVERFRQYPEVNEQFFEFWLETDDKLFSKTQEAIKFSNLHEGTRAGDFQSKETWLQKGFDDEFAKHWYGMGPLRGIGYATAEYLWKAEYVKDWAENADSQFTPEREKLVKSTLSRHACLIRSVDQWSQSSTALFSGKLTEDELNRRRELLARFARARERNLEEYRDWISYNVISPRIGQASLLAWKADYCDKEVYQKRNTMKQVFSALEAIDPRILRECNEDIRGQYRAVVGEVDSYCKKNSSIQANFQMNLEAQFNIIKIF